jgi:diguanylate cyclase
MDKSLKTEIEIEYKKIDRKWLYLHFYASVGLVVFAFILECFIGRLLYVTGEISISIPKYLMKFLILPSLFNIFLIAINYFVIQSGKIDQDIKINTVSSIYVIHCFVIFTVHGTFSALFFMFSAPILLTAIYGKYKLSSFIAFISIVSLIVSELFIPWDLDKINVMESGIRLGNFIISIVVLIFFYIVSMVIIYFEREKHLAGLQKELERYRLRKRLLKDDLTGVGNRIAFRDIIDEMEADTSGSHYVFVMIDIDNFKFLNDNLGHVAGDECLIDFAGILKENCRKGTPFRYGGDEFSLLFKNSSINQVVQCCERIQKEFKSIPVNNRADFQCTLSFGIASYTGNMTPSQLIINSDSALYQSKINKNTITVYDYTLV